MSPDGLRWLRRGLHGLFAGLVLLTVVRVWIASGLSSLLGAVALTSIVFTVTYALGVFSTVRRVFGWWLLVLSLEWLLLVWLTPEAAYLVFPLFFLYLHLLPGWRGPTMVVGSTAAAVVAIGQHGQYSVGGVVGPVVAALVAIAIASGYRALARESADRQHLIDDLMAAQQQLAISERERGILDERTRLAGEIHDTLAQGLSSIQMLLHAAERAHPQCPGVEHMQLARSTASENLVEARQMVRELSPANLTSDSLPNALSRVGQSSALTVDVAVTGQTRVLPMVVETGLLRIAQGAVGNVEQHAGVDHACIELEFGAETVVLRITDDGVGFDAPPTADSATAEPATRRWESAESFGFDVMRRRVEQIGGTFTVDTEPGEGTRVTVKVPA